MADERDVAAAVERLRDDARNGRAPSLHDTDAVCDALAQAQDAIARAIDRMAPDAPNHDPHMLCGAVTLMEANLAQAQQEIARTMKVLDPAMPSSGLEDAARQVKQVAISAMDNSEQADALARTLAQALDEVKRCPRCDSCRSTAEAMLASAAVQALLKG